jgi:hypothetical protein
MPTAPTTTTTGGLPPCGTIDENGLNCQGLKPSDSEPPFGCSSDFWGQPTTYWMYFTYYTMGRECDCTKICCSDDAAVFENGECDTTLSGR